MSDVSTEISQSQWVSRFEYNELIAKVNLLEERLAAMERLWFTPSHPLYHYQFIRPNRQFMNGVLVCVPIINISSLIIHLIRRLLVIFPCVVYLLSSFPSLFLLAWSQIWSSYLLYYLSIHLLTLCDSTWSLISRAVSTINASDYPIRIHSQSISLMRIIIKFNYNKVFLIHLNWFNQVFKFQLKYGKVNQGKCSAKIWSVKLEEFRYKYGALIKKSNYIDKYNISFSFYTFVSQTGSIISSYSTFESEQYNNYG